MPSPTALTRVRAALERDTVGGALLLAVTVLALTLANSPAEGWFTTVRDTVLGPDVLGLGLTAGQWASDGLLAVFFFVVGLELKGEMVAGDLRDPRRAAVPIAAAVGGVAVPALVFVALNAGAGQEALRGWAIPTATDIALAAPLLAVLARGLPAAVRVFLLTLAVIDDLIAITVIAVVYPTGFTPAPLLAALLPLLLFAIAVHRGIRTPWLLLPLAVTAWVLVHASGVHATVTGVLLGMTVPVLAPTGRGDDRTARAQGLAARFEQWWRPVSTGFAVPVFAFFATGITVGGLNGLTTALGSSVAQGTIAGLVVGKAVGINSAAWLTTRLTTARLSDGVRWGDVAAVSLLGGIGFTVSLLVGELAYGPATELDNTAKVGVLLGSTTAALLAALALRLRAHTTPTATGP